MKRAPKKDRPAGPTVGANGTRREAALTVARAPHSCKLFLNRQETADDLGVDPKTFDRGVDAGTYPKWHHEKPQGKGPHKSDRKVKLWSRVELEVWSTQKRRGAAWDRWWAKNGPDLTRRLVVERVEHLHAAPGMRVERLSVEHLHEHEGGAE